jgi:tryptophanyl-tRNA synthetase
LLLKKGPLEKNGNFMYSFNMLKIFSGIRPSGKLHLGNYLGAIKNWIELQDKASAENGGQAIFAVVDYHGITTPYDTKGYKVQVADAVLDYLAAGVDPAKSLLIRQSMISEHTELTWILSTITPVGWLDRLPNYREKVEQVEHSGNEHAKSYQNNTALLTYPVLMASDILLYKSNLVPVGDDQKQHLDLTNEIAKRFNFLFGETFEPVKPHIVEGARIMSLQDPTKKMSKTGDDGIALTDDADTIAGKIKRAVTDSGKEIIYKPEEKPAISNLLLIYSLLSGKKIKEIEKDYDSKTYVDFKKGLTEVTVEYLKKFQQRRKVFEDDPQGVLAILMESEDEASDIASRTMTEIKKKMGL